MSHTVTIKTEVRDPVAIDLACRRLKLERSAGLEHELFSGKHTGIGVKLPGWHYPAVCDTQSGQVHFDNYGGHWGDQRELDRFIQAYAVEKARLEARKLGHSVTEAQQVDGSILLTVNT